jgi:acyl-CoA thioester hydrolase
MAYRHRVRVRYGECDMQQVVFNANYLAYIDDAIDTWMRTVLGPIEQLGFDFMVKKATVEWQAPARFGETLDLDVSVARWGRSSFDVLVLGSAGERPIFTATLVYVSTTPGSATSTPIPDSVRATLDAHAADSAGPSDASSAAGAPGSAGATAAAAKASS